MAQDDLERGAARNIRLYPWFKFAQSLLFWQATWFLYFQGVLSGAEAILLYAIYDIGTTVAEVPSGYMSDRIGRRWTLLMSSVAGVGAMALLATGDTLLLLAIGQLLMGLSMAFSSGTDTSMLYESLRALGRDAEVEAQELKAWRFGFAGLAVSAVTGGAMALWNAALPFWATGAAFCALISIAFAFREPALRDRTEGAARRARVALIAALREPVLGWLFVLAVLMYGFSHLPFVFGQPFILRVLEPLGLATEAPLVSGGISTAMMVLSLAGSVFAARIRARMGLAALLLLAFAMQIGIAAALTVGTSAGLMAVLLLRMVPDALSKPFITARIQPLLASETRATYLSIQSFAARIVFAASLALAAGTASDASALPFADIRTILLGFSAIGLVALATLWFWARRLPLDEAPGVSGQG